MENNQKVATKNAKIGETENNNDYKVVTLVEMNHNNGNYTVHNWFASNHKEARKIAESVAKCIQDEVEEFYKKNNITQYSESQPDKKVFKTTKEWVDEDHYRMYSGDGKPNIEDYYGSRYVYDFYIKSFENQ